MKCLIKAFGKPAPSSPLFVLIYCWGLVVYLALKSRYTVYCGARRKQPREEKREEGICWINFYHPALGSKKAISFSLENILESSSFEMKYYCANNDLPGPKIRVRYLHSIFKPRLENIWAKKLPLQVVLTFDATERGKKTCNFPCKSAVWRSLGPALHSLKGSS